jgi:UDP-N-acetylmuramoyl-tripeptide--D-alanyl-D-alanine ligase
MNHAGELRRLSEIARPDIGVVTNVGSAHVEFFDSIEGVALAKRELIESLPPDGTAVLNADDPRVSRFREVHPGRTVTFGFSEEAEVRPAAIPLPLAEIPLPGRHGVLNLLAGLAVARVLGLSPDRLGDSIRTLKPATMRGEIIHRNGVTIINDCYNANPEAVRSMLDLLGATPAQRRLAVLGEMLELGRSAEPLHRAAGRYAAKRGIDLLIGVRGAARFTVEAAREAGMADGAAVFFETPDEAGDFVRALLKEGDAVLLKGSRRVMVERALERLLE